MLKVYTGIYNTDTNQYCYHDIIHPMVLCHKEAMVKMKDVRQHALPKNLVKLVKTMASLSKEGEDYMFLAKKIKRRYNLHLKDIKEVISMN